MYMIFIC
ncbi:hypothetical protein F383_32602 [Gossypium arboreum]|nr:hypothetical protein F383_32602 [Gossypium arboreum]